MSCATPRTFSSASFPCSQKAVKYITVHLQPGWDKHLCSLKVCLMMVTKLKFLYSAVSQALLCLILGNYCLWAQETFSWNIFLFLHLKSLLLWFAFAILNVAYAYWTLHFQERNSRASDFSDIPHYCCFLSNLGIIFRI